MVEQGEYRRRALTVVYWRFHSMWARLTEETCLNEWGVQLFISFFYFFRSRLGFPGFTQVNNGQLCRAAFYWFSLLTSRVPHEINCNDIRLHQHHSTVCVVACVFVQLLFIWDKIVFFYVLCEKNLGHQAK